MVPLAIVVLVVIAIRTGTVEDSSEDPGTGTGTDTTRQPNPIASPRMCRFSASTFKFPIPNGYCNFWPLVWLWA